MTRILALATVMTALILAGFALAQGPYGQAEPQPNATVEARTLTQTKTQATVRQQRFEQRLEQRLDERLEQSAKAMQTARHERAMLQECDDREPTATARRQQRGPQANW